MLQPDLFVFRAARRAAPCLARDHVADPRDRDSLAGHERYDRTVKRRRYQRAGTPEYWVVDLDEHRVERWRPDAVAAEVMTDRMTWQPDPQFPALDIDLTTFLAALHG